MDKLLYVVACGAPPAAELPGFVSWAQQHGWRVCVIATPQGSKFLDAARLAELTGYPVRQDYKQPDEPDERRSRRMPTWSPRPRSTRSTSGPAGSATRSRSAC